MSAFIQVPSGFTKIEVQKDGQLRLFYNPKEGEKITVDFMDDINLYVWFINNTKKEEITPKEDSSILFKSDVTTYHPKVKEQIELFVKEPKDVQNKFIVEAMRLHELTKKELDFINHKVDVNKYKQFILSYQNTDYNIRRLFAEYLKLKGEKDIISALPIDIAFPKECVVIPIERTNGHSYELNLPYQKSINGSITQFLRWGSKVEMGNSMEPVISNLRLPDLMEIVAMLYARNNINFELL